VAAINAAPNLSPSLAVDRLYPYKLFLPPEGCQSVEQTLETFHLLDKSAQGATSVESVTSASAASAAEIRVGRKLHKLPVATGSRQLVDPSADPGEAYVPTPYHESLLVRKDYPKDFLCFLWAMFSSKHTNIAY
jgi:hypothetical protein